MPEQITKYPDVTRTLLRRAGARCGKGEKQKILTQCPADQFCALAGGEICIYGIKDIPRMTQITTQELAAVVCPSPQQPSKVELAPARADMALLGATFAAGLVLGRFWRRVRNG